MSDSTSSPPTCSECGRPADLLCDAVIGLTGEWREEEAPTRVGSHLESRKRKRFVFAGLMAEASETFTCDLPICQRCSEKRPPLFICGTDGVVVIDDWCPYHQQHGDDVVPLLPADAAPKRRRLHMGILARAPASDLATYSGEGIA